MTEEVDERRELARSTATQTVLVAVSRLTGFVRVVVVAAVLGTTFLGNTYQSANTIPNIVFELFAAGALQAVLVPALVARFDRGDDEGAERLAGSVLGLTGAALAAFAVVGAVAAPWLMRAMVSGVDDPAVRADQVSLGAVFLWIFLPQVIVYDVGLVATAVLHARSRFALPAIAPAVNNVVVCAAYGAFAWMRRGEEPSLDLSVAEIAVLGGGTTAAVLAFCAVPIVGARRAGFRFRPNLDRSDPALRALGRQGAWAAVYLAMTQVLLAAVLVFANRVEGGVVGYQVAFTFFLLPHALFALPVLNTLFPAASRHVQRGDWDRLRATVRRGTLAIGLFVLPAAAALAALAQPLAASISFGNVGQAGTDLVADVVVGFAPGLVGYSLFYFLTRVLYAWDDARSPATVHGVVVAAGVVAMAISAATVPTDQLVPALAWSHSGTYLAGAVALAVIVARRLGEHGHRVHFPRLLAPPVVGAVAAAAAMVAIVAVVDADGRVGQLVSIAAGGIVGIPVYVLVETVTGGPRPSAVVDLLRPRKGAGP